jgi:hypothetical protein
MGRHGAPIRVYGPSRLRWSAPLLIRPASRYVFWTTVLGTCLGAALLTRRMWLPGMALVGLAAVVVLLVVSTLFARPHVVVADREHLKTWQCVEQSCTMIIAAWPSIGAMIGVKDAATVIENARWDLACLIARRGGLSGAHHQATFAEYGLDPNVPLRDDLAVRRDQLALRLASIDAEIANRVGRLRSLAERCAHFAHEQAAARRAPRVARRARQALERADSAILSVTPWEVRPDPATDLSDRTEAVLTAYRELTEGSKDGGG